MWRRLYDRKAQSTGEYALVFAIILGAIVAMQTYVKRGVQGRIKSGTDYMARATGDEIGTDGFRLDSIDDGVYISQYDPYFYTSQYDTRRDGDETRDYTEGQADLTVAQDDTSRDVAGYTEFTRAEWQDVTHPTQ